MKMALRIFASAWLLQGSALAFASAGVAFVTDMRGESSIAGARLALMAELAEGQHILVSQKGAISVMFVGSGDEYALTGPGEYSVQSNHIVVRKGGGTGGSTSKRATPWRMELNKVVDVSKSATASLRVRSVNFGTQQDKNTLRVLSPNDTRVSTLSPVLTWSPLAGIKSYGVSVKADGANIYSARSEKAEHKLAAALKPGVQYVWTVAAGDQLAEGKFATVSAEELKRIGAIRPGNRSTFSDMLLYAVSLHHLGATQEARELWRSLAAQRPLLPELAALAQ